ncbi:hypothetical protein BpHYR1_042086 [Brachionus plicatilis]|uniref:hAT-like transposase RNase-H fold domain-containing protein n=1 Tax=Brachionus plicatilis TaxID=10195 RepID=A0A3M7QVZ6_BRAPC|nr:hypothetical protein BpHYR1_042086 [Brachionus plicatilis]
MGKSLDLLEPFNQIANVLQTHTTGTLDLSGDSYNSCSQLYLIFIELMAHLDTKLKEKKYSSLKLTIESMKLKIEDYWHWIKPAALICTILDPRFKCDGIFNLSILPRPAIVPELFKSPITI